MILALFACAICFQQGPTTPILPPKPSPKPQKRIHHVVHKIVKPKPVVVAPPKFVDNPTGSGAPVQVGELVTIQFLVKRINGDSLADSKKRGLPYTFRIGAPGNDPLLDMVVKGMKVGAVRTQTVAAKDAYGPAGAPPTIAAKDTLIVQITLLHRGAQ